MREPTSIYAVRRRAVRLWLLAVAVLIFAMVLVGGATRLTESGLSITEWHPISGTMPPLSQADWNAEFDGYKAIPQYKLLNRDMTLDEFKSIFWWEWTHRQLGRVIGAAFLLPFLWFLWRGWIEPGMRGPLSAIFGLGAFQGGVGWWMVASGLAGRTEVSQYRLAFHLTLACLIYVAILWAGERFAERRAPAVPVRLRVGAVVLLVLVLAQIYLGALVAGLRAGLLYNTWPEIDGAFIPPAARLLFEQPWWRNLFDNALTVQFEHRMTAYALFALAVLHALDAVRSRAGSAVIGGVGWLAAALMLQATLGILTLLNQVPIDLALAHQAMAIVVLTLSILNVERLTARRTESDRPKLALPSVAYRSR
jgi:cytochrome c oxidase assembly protein subunit 15